MLIQVRKEEFKIKTLIRAWEVDPELIGMQAVLEARKGLSSGVKQVVGKSNMIMDAGMYTFMAKLMGTQQAWQTGKWARQALGANPTEPVASDTGLSIEMFRKAFTDYSSDGHRMIIASTYFAAQEFICPSTSLSISPPSQPTASQFYVVDASKLIVDANLQVVLATGYEYSTIASADPLTGLVVLNTPLSAAPATGSIVSIMIEEAGVFGDAPAAYSTGTVATTNGSPIITGTGTAWSTNVSANDQISVGTDNKFYTIQSVDSDTQLTLSSNYGGTTQSGATYFFRGTLYSKVNGIHYSKPGDRGFVFEARWQL